MIVKLTPGDLHGTIAAPPSKSMAHRLLIGAALSGGSVVKNVAFSDDIMATNDALSILGASSEVCGTTVKIGGFDPFIPDANEIFCRESGSTIRFLLPLCLLGRQKISLCGAESLMKRPFSVYEELCQNHGLLFDKDGQSICVRGPLSSGSFQVDGTISSQFVSGLLFALPLLKGESRISFLKPPESLSYIRMTIDALSVYGITAFFDNPLLLIVPGGQSYQIAESTVEGDWSNASVFYGMSLFRDDITVYGLNDHSRQGDKVCRGILQKLNNGHPTVSLADCPDLGPVLFTVAALKNGAVFTDTDRLHYKESDRIASMREELHKIGSQLIENENCVTVIPTKKVPSDCKFEAHNDHRIAMSAALICSLYGGTIYGAEAVKKSYPDFFDQLSEIGVGVEKNDFK